MKAIKNILLLFICLCSLSSGLLAQSESVDQRVKENQPYATYTGTAADSIGKTDSTFTYVFKVNQPHKTTPYIFVDLDSLRGTADTLYVIYQSKAFDTQKFVTLDTSIWVNSSSADAVYNPGSAVLQEYFRVFVKGQTDEYAVTINGIYCKFSYSE